METNHGMEASKPKLNWNKQNTIALLQKAKAYPCIWDYDCADFKKKVVKRECFAKVKHSLKKEFPELANVDTDQVKAKFNHLRSYYHREQRRLQGKRPSNWDYFQHCSYLHTTGIPYSFKDNLKHLPEASNAGSSSSDKPDYLEGEAETTEITDDLLIEVLPTEPDTPSSLSDVTVCAIEKPSSQGSSSPSSHWACSPSPQWTSSPPHPSMETLKDQNQNAKKRKRDPLDVFENTIDNLQKIIQKEQQLQVCKKEVLTDGDRVKAVYDGYTAYMSSKAQKKDFFSAVLGFIVKYASAIDVIEDA